MHLYIATKSSEPVKQHRVQLKNRTESFSDNQKIVSESLSDAKLKKVYTGKKETCCKF